MWEIQIVEVKSSPSSAFKEGKTSRRRRLEMQLALNNLRLYLNLVCLQLLFILERTSKFVVQQFFSIVGFFKTHLFSIVIFSQKYLLPAFQPVTYTLIVFKYGTTHTEVVNAHQASKFRVLEARRKHIFSLFQPFLF